MSPRPAGRSILDAIARGGLIGDGALGSLLHDRGVPFDVCYEELAVSRPALVAGIHEEYVRAGADVIETDSFGGNRLRLSRFGLGDRAREINLAAARLARRAAGERAFVAGAVGPTGISFDGGAAGAEPAALREAFREQAAALVEGGADAIVIETMRWPEEIDLAVAGARLGVGGEAPILVHVALGPDLTMADGTPIDALGPRLLAAGCDAVGVNCCEAAALAAVEVLLPLGLPVSAFPSAGLPRRRGDRFVYPTTADDFGRLSRELRARGAGLVGGCCGTTPAHVDRARAELCAERRAAAR